jgi:hypothetical protein
MDTLAVRNVSVWLDGVATWRDTFAHGVEWASRLQLPLRAIVAGPGREGHAAWPQEAVRGNVAAEQIQSCARVCAEKGVPWDGLWWRDPAGAGLEQILRPSELCVLGNALPLELKAQLLRHASGSARSPLLVCSPSWRPVSRILMVHQRRDPGSRFLNAAADVCHAFGVMPAVLTVARTEGEARRRQGFAEEALAGLGVAADFDLVSGCDVRTAVKWIAPWRHCSHVLLERPSARPWWRRLRGDTPEQLLGLSDSLTLLTLPEPDPAAPREGDQTAERDRRAEGPTGKRRTLAWINPAS